MVVTAGLRSLGFERYEQAFRTMRSIWWDLAATEKTEFNPLALEIEPGSSNCHSTTVRVRAAAAK